MQGTSPVPASDPTHRLNLAAGFASVAVAVTLVGLKLWALGATGALSVAASLADSALDLVASLAALLGIRYAAKPPDTDHSFGHTSVEDLVALGQALIVTASAAAIGWSALGRLGAPRTLAAETAGIAVMFASVAVTAVLVIWQTRVARRTGSRIVAADRLHYLSDLWPNLGAIVALWAAARHGVLWLDPAVALAACAILLLGARRIGIQAWHALMDRRADPAQLARIEAVLRNYPGLKGHHDLRTRTAGTRVFVQVHVEIDGDLPLRDAHAISARLKRDLVAALPEADVIIHQDPV
ncbi:MAG: cation transporter [Rhodobacteraceae bacterium]|nr:cation transporter [Paracoccaceae bacterium]